MAVGPSAYVYVSAATNTRLVHLSVRTFLQAGAEIVHDLFLSNYFLLTIHEHIPFESDSCLITAVEITSLYGVGLKQRHMRPWLNALKPENIRRTHQAYGLIHQFHVLILTRTWAVLSSPGVQGENLIHVKTVSFVKQCRQGPRYFDFMINCEFYNLGR
jgi:hypothetical protein